ncbi:Uncharacterized protein ChrSV_2763 [Chromobacterium vaccinii]|nr:Uncharacterized protein ChrSW_2763 [Chromobacterium vaccinii]QND90220.1 Uncharacterized protein ChrSV_2763 [Chromobacterium vaccinii]
MAARPFTWIFLSRNKCILALKQRHKVRISNWNFINNNSFQNDYSFAIKKSP